VVPSYHKSGLCVSDLLFEHRTEFDAYSAFVEKPFTRAVCAKLRVVLALSVPGQRA
jgi:hypothetical protein